MSAALQRIRRVVTIEWPKATERGAKAFLIRTARTGHQKIMADAATKGLAPTWDAYANSPGNKDLASVKLPGPIVYNYRYLSDLLQVAMDELERNSPRQSGAYIRGHTIFVNGQAVSAVPKTIKAGDQIYIANLVPYARKIEIGKTQAGRAFVIQVPNRIYERVTKLLKSRYRGQADIRFGYIDVGSHALRRSQGRRSDRARGASVKSPAIFMTALA